MIVVTGAAGFIGSCMIRKLNDLGRRDLILVDDFSRAEKAQNLEGKAFSSQIDRDLFPRWFEKNASQIEAVIHLGARTDTTEKSTELFDRLNLHYSQALWIICAGAGVPLFYASSAATYGAGENGWDDDPEKLPFLKPLNPYGQSKHDFDRWALAQKAAPPNWAGFKFFNVYGPNEGHKNRMASVIFHTFEQVKMRGEMRLFRSHRPDFGDGEQSRDFVYVKDVVDVLAFFVEKKPKNGLINLGTGKARSYFDLAAATFKSLDLEPNISFIDTPEDIRESYQYFTEANISRLREAGFVAPFWSLEAGIDDYVRGFLRLEKIW